MRSKWDQRHSHSFMAVGSLFTECFYTNKLLQNDELAVSAGCLATLAESEDQRIHWMNFSLMVVQSFPFPQLVCVLFRKPFFPAGGPSGNCIPSCNLKHKKEDNSRDVIIIIIKLWPLDQNIWLLLLFLLFLPSKCIANFNRFWENWQKKMGTDAGFHPLQLCDC